ncbi:carbohydrate kinase family protein [Candidatus Uhrbacteria bacterium]|nr:carbohydrate kinase family protein [Candidatus Uhrbacteria bacterium]
MHDLVTIGDIKLDTFVVLPEAHLQCSMVEGNKTCWLCLEHGTKIPVEDFEPQIAGSAVNVAVGMSRLGFRTAIVAMLGADATAPLARAVLKEEHVDARYLRVLKRERSSFSVVITYKGQRTMLAAHRPHHYHLPALAPFKWLYLSEMGKDYEELFRDLVTMVKRRGAKLAFNPGAIQLQGGARKLAPVIKATDVLFVNREEAHQLVNNRANGIDLRHLITRLWKQGPQVIVLTDGSKGSYAFDGGDILHLEPFPAKPVEMTGAGDSFATGFLAARMYGKDIGECLRWGAANAASVIGVVGPQPGLLSKTKVARALRMHRAITTKTL